MLYLVIFEIMVFILFAICIRDARRQGRYYVKELFWAAVYGLLLEWLTIRQLQAYHYGDFLVMIDNAPLSVGLGWAVIIYSVMRLTSEVQLPSPTRPVLNALLALNIDLALDTIAIRLGMWHWTGVAFDQQWFGVPWANFWAWFLVVWSYSMFLYALRNWRAKSLGKWFYAPLAVVMSLLVLVIANSLYDFVNDKDTQAFASAFVLVGSLAIIYHAHPRVLRPMRDPIIIVPFAFHAFALIMGAALGYFTAQPVLGVIGIFMLVLSLIVHRSLSQAR